MAILCARLLMIALAIASVPFAIWLDTVLPTEDPFAIPAVIIFSGALIAAGIVWWRDKTGTPRQSAKVHDIEQERARRAA